MFGLGPKSKRTKPLVLHIDDDPITRALISETFTEIGVDVLNASNGADGIKTALKELSDLILLDVEMPGMTGYEACQSLKTNPKSEKIPIRMITGMDPVKNVEKALACGANSYITKPFQLDRLHAKARPFLFPDPASPSEQPPAS